MQNFDSMNFTLQHKIINYDDKFKLNLPFHAMDYIESNHINPPAACWQCISANSGLLQRWMLLLWCDAMCISIVTGRACVEAAALCHNPMSSTQDSHPLLIKYKSITYLNNGLPSSANKWMDYITCGCALTKHTNRHTHIWASHWARLMVCCVWLNLLHPPPQSHNRSRVSNVNCAPPKRKALAPQTAIFRVEYSYGRGRLPRTDMPTKHRHHTWDQYSQTRDTDWWRWRWWWDAVIKTPTKKPSSPHTAKDCQLVCSATPTRLQLSSIVVYKRFRVTDHMCHHRLTEMTIWRTEHLQYGTEKMNHS